MKLTRIVALLLTLTLAAGCAGAPPASPATTEIIFLADPPEIQPGDCSLLVWDAPSGFVVTLNGEAVAKAGNQQVCPSQSTTYTLEVDLGTSMENHQVELRVSGESLEASPEPQADSGVTPGPISIEPGTPAYQAEAWVALGNPPGDLGYDIRYNFDDHDIWYVTDGTAGFHISTDRGLTWEPSNNGIAGFEATSNVPVFSATVDPHDADTIWIGTQFTGHIYKSTDGGQTWIQKDEGVEPHAGLHFRGFTVDPRSSDIVYAQAEVDSRVFVEAGRPGPNPDPAGVGGRVYRTTDGGEHWSMIWEGHALARYLWIDPGDPDVLYVSTGIFDRTPLNAPAGMLTTPWDAGGLGVLKSTDGGQSWTVLGEENGLEMLHVGSLYMKPGDPQTLLAGAGAITLGGEGEPSGIVYLTQDGGDSWRPVVTGDLAVGAVEFCEQDPQVAYAAGELRVYRSADGGLTWQGFGDATRRTWGPPGLYPGMPIDIQVDPDDPGCNRLFINNYIGGNFLSTDGGKTWSVATQGYSGANVLGLDAAADDPGHVYAGVRMAAFVSEDGGDTWQSISNPDLVRGVLTQALDPSDSDHLLIIEGERGTLAPPLFESHDGGSSWEHVFSLACPPGITDDAWGRMKFWEMAFAPSDTSIVYGASLNPPPDFEAQMGDDYLIGVGVYRSSDGGTTWAAANDAAIANLGFASIAVHPTDPQTVYAGTHGGEIFKTTDGGQSWEERSSGLPSEYNIIRALAIDAGQPEIVFAGTSMGMFRSLDGGASWEQVTSGLVPEETVTDIVLDPSHAGVLYAGTARGGVFYSMDGGESFTVLQQGLDTSRGGLSIQRLALSPDGAVLYAGTRGQGVYRLGAPAPPES